MAIAGTLVTREHQATLQSHDAPLKAELKCLIAQILIRIRAQGSSRLNVVDSVKCPASRLHHVSKPIIMIGSPRHGRASIGFDTQGNLYELFGTCASHYTFDREDTYNLLTIRTQLKSMLDTFQHS